MLKILYRLRHYYRDVKRFIHSETGEFTLNEVAILNKQIEKLVQLTLLERNAQMKIILEESIRRCY